MLYPSKSCADFVVKTLKYTFKEGDKRSRVFANPKTHRRLVIPQRDLLDEATVTSILRQAGEEMATVTKFLESGKKEGEALSSDPKKTKR